MLKCIRCKKYKNRHRFCSRKITAYMCDRFDIPEPPIPKTKASLLCKACHRTLCKKKNQKQHNQRPKYRLSRNIRTGIYKSFRTGKPGLWEYHVGYTTAELKEYLQRQFELGMSWRNYGQWHIDHIRPISTFDFTKYQDHGFKQCWALSNLQPLWARDNWTKKKAGRGKEQ